MAKKTKETNQDISYLLDCLQSPVDADPKVPEVLRPQSTTQTVLPDKSELAETALQDKSQPRQQSRLGRKSHSDTEWEQFLELIKTDNPQNRAERKSVLIDTDLSKGLTAIEIKGATLSAKVNSIIRLFVKNNFEKLKSLTSNTIFNS